MSKKSTIISIIIAVTITVSFLLFRGPLSQQEGGDEVVVPIEGQQVPSVSNSQPINRPISKSEPYFSDCGDVQEIVSDGEVPEGWVISNDEYLCLSIAHPEDWRTTRGSNSLPPEGLPMPLTIFAPNNDGLDFPVMEIFPLIQTDETLPLIEKTLQEIQLEYVNGGAEDMEVYTFESFEDESSQGTRKKQYFLVHIANSSRVYIVVGRYYIGDLSEFDFEPIVKKVVELLSSI